VTIHTELWGWPQWTMISIAVLSALMVISMHGMPRTGTYNAVVTVLLTGLQIYILAKGGFFG
jgi:hypothetical protein